MNTKELVAESNRIEGIMREPTDDEIVMFKEFLYIEKVTVADMENFVNIYEPGAKLRDKPGMDVYVGNHHPPSGNPEIRQELDALLGVAQEGIQAAYEIHIWYETLHPFMDGNGRSGRMLWYWMMRDEPIARKLGFLHTWYYQSLSGARK